MTPSDIREAVARAICRAYGTDPDDLTAYPAQKSWEVTTMLAWERWLDEADAALSVLIPACQSAIRAKLMPDLSDGEDREGGYNVAYNDALRDVAAALSAMLTKDAVDG